MVEFDMDCSQNENGWFEVKAFLTNGGINQIVKNIAAVSKHYDCFLFYFFFIFVAGWESDISQSTCTGSAGGRAPYTSKNHLGRCGFVNVFDFGMGTCLINPISA
jgi:alpha-amylase